MILIISKVYGSEICVFMARSLCQRILPFLASSVEQRTLIDVLRVFSIGSILLLFQNWFLNFLASGIFAMSSAIFRDFHDRKIGTRSAFVPVFHHFIRKQLRAIAFAVRVHWYQTRPVTRASGTGGFVSGRAMFDTSMLIPNCAQPRLQIKWKYTAALLSLPS